jgi:hypothetical protein
LKTNALGVGSTLGFFTSVSSGVSSVVVARFLPTVVKIDGLNESKIMQMKFSAIEILTGEFSSFLQRLID